MLATSPIIKDNRSTYPGGKSGAGVYQAIINRIPPHRVYIEPFMGSGGILRHKRPAQISVGVDIDPVVTGAWGEFLSSNPTPWDAVPAPGGSLDSGGGFRKAIPELGVRPGNSPENQDGSSYLSPDLGVGDEPRLHILNLPAIRFLKTFDYRMGGHFVYADPPYLHETRKDLEIYQYEMSDQDHVELLECLASLPCMVMVSGYDSRLYNEMLKGWTTHTFTAQTRRGPATEKIWFNYPVPDRLHDYAYVGETYRKRYRWKEKKRRWKERLMALPPLERNAMFQALSDAMSPEGN